ncbi:MAG: hypothetical protein Q8N61_01770 [bacterium]|nr:hypothetical protein [bacterium]
MKKIKKIPASFQTALWSYDISKMDIEKDKKGVITQVLNYGTWDNLKLLFKIYSEKEIKKVIKNPSRGIWFEKVLNFWTTIFNIRLKKDVFQKAIFNINPH